MKKLYTFIILIGIILQANAQIIYTDIPDTIITGPSGLYNLDIDNDGHGISTAINDKELAFISVYNANRDLVINNPNNANLDLKVLNMADQVLKTIQFNYAINNIKINSLASGVYVVSILNTDNNSFFNKKLLIK